MTVKLTCKHCGSTKNIPNKTCTWQCPSCSKPNLYNKDIEERPIVYIPDKPSLSIDAELIYNEDNPIDYEY